MGAADKLIADMLIEHGINILRFGVGVRAQVLDILQNMQIELTTQLIADDISDNARSRSASSLTQVTKIIAQYYAEINGVVDEGLKGAAKAAVAAVADAVEKSIQVSIANSLPTANVLEALASNVLIGGAPTSAWWDKQASDTAFKFSNAIRQGISQGESNSQIVARIAGTKNVPGLMSVTRKQAAQLVHASVQTVSNTARRMTYEQNTDVVDGLQQVSTLDGRTSDVCIAYSGATWDMNYEPIGDTTLPYNGGCPRHFGCRSVETPLLKSFADMGIDLPEFKPTTRASRDGQVNANMTFAEFLDGKSEEFQNELLGKGRAQLWRDGTITLQQLLDQNGNPLTLAQLLAKYGK